MDAIHNLYRRKLVLTRQFFHVLKYIIYICNFNSFKTPSWKGKIHLKISSIVKVAELTGRAVRLGGYMNRSDMFI